MKVNFLDLKADLLYIHYPFCVQKCDYCDFYSVNFNKDISKRYEKLFFEKYKTLLKRRYETIYIGGGTPSLSISFLEKILETVCPALEITIEFNPNISSEIFSLLKDYKGKFEDFRLSFGIQSLKISDLKFLGRRVRISNDFFNFVEKLKEEGFLINFDFIYLKESIMGDINSVLHLLDHISVYELTLYKETLLSFKLKQNSFEFDVDYLKLANFLREKGFLWYEVSNFTREKECRHNVGYWLFKDWLGLGAAATSKIGGFVFKYSDLRDFFQQNLKLEYLNDEDFEFLKKYYRLRYFKPVNVALFSEEEIEKLLNNKLAVIKEKSLYLTDLGKLNFSLIFN